MVQSVNRVMLSQRIISKLDVLINGEIIRYDSSTGCNVINVEQVTHWQAGNGVRGNAQMVSHRK